MPIPFPLPPSFLSLFLSPFPIPLSYSPFLSLFLLKSQIPNMPSPLPLKLLTIVPLHIKNYLALSIQQWESSRGWRFTFSDCLLYLSSGRDVERLGQSNHLRILQSGIRIKEGFNMLCMNHFSPTLYTDIYISIYLSTFPHNHRILLGIQESFRQSFILQFPPWQQQSQPSQPGCRWVDNSATFMQVLSWDEATSYYFCSVDVILQYSTSFIFAYLYLCIFDFLEKKTINI